MMGYKVGDEVIAKVRISEVYEKTIIRMKQ